MSQGHRHGSRVGRFSTEDDIELRRVSITNRGRTARTIELTSFAEVVLATPAADASHPAFSNLFVQTRILREQQAILCTRRPLDRRQRAEAAVPPFSAVRSRRKEPPVVVPKTECPDGV